MKKIYFLHGYQTSGKKFECLQNFYQNFEEYNTICWDWDEFMNIPKFLEDKAKILKENCEDSIIMADSMGANIAWHLVNSFKGMHYVMTNPVFSAEQIKEQERIPAELKEKIFSATSENILNKNIHLIISKNDEVLNPNYYKKVFGTSLKILELDDVHAITHMNEYMPSIHQVIMKAFDKANS
ncbi:YqiA/YcfP family alpha/beta fold hydrolase [uncultured Apibacter sp.]|uniref:YqiA/YcfP family alpha/beta fold hydrolase n=1 Tax=uncultured Apibacter sp. TaxID=1778616 RepID=UPI0025F15499|nr:YqiA/YcfP family alpha/beta fold hydrolase [uncultured Apibacter sp.]